MLAVLLIRVAVAGLNFTGASTCPTPGEVRVALAAQFGEPALGGAGDTARVDPAADGGGASEVRLFDTRGQLQGARTLGGSCAARARAAATVIVAWRGQPMAVPEPASTRLPQQSSVSEGSLRPPADPWRFAAGASVATVGSSPGSRPLLALQGTVRGETGPAAGGLRLLGRICVETVRSEPLGAGRVEWRRSAIGLGLGLIVWRAPGWALVAEGLVWPALLSLSGKNFPSNLASERPDLGLAAGMRASWALGDFRPFVDLGATIWTLNAVATSAPTPSVQAGQVRLPQAEFAGGIGVDLELGPRPHP